MAKAFNPQMELLDARQARSDLPMSHAARLQFGQATGARPQVNEPQAEAIGQQAKTKHKLPATCYQFIQM